MTKIMAVIFLAFALSGCATINAMSPMEQRQVTTLVLTKCPSLKKYSQAQLLRAANELRTLPTDAMVAIIITDYGKLRVACRVLERNIR